MAESVQGSTPTSLFALSFINTKAWTFADTTVWAEPWAVKAADAELGEEQVRADSWSGQFKSPCPQWLRLVLDTEGCVGASAQPGSVRVCVCVSVSMCPCVMSSGKPSSTEEGSGLGLINTPSLATYTSVSLSLWGPPLTCL